MSDTITRCRWKLVEIDALVQKAGAIFLDPVFVESTNTHGQVQVFLQQLQECLPEARRRELTTLKQLPPVLQEKVRGAHAAAGSPILSGHFMKFINAGPVQQVELLHVQRPQPSAEAPAAGPEAPTGPGAEAPPERPAVTPVLLEALSKLKPSLDAPAVDGIVRKALAEQPPIEPIVRGVLEQQPARDHWIIQSEQKPIDILKEARKHLSLVDAFCLLIYKLSKDPMVVGALMQALSKDAPTPFDTGKIIREDILGPDGKVHIRVANPRGNQFGDIQAALVSKGYGQMVSLTESETAKTVFTVFFLQGTNHPQYQKEQDVKETSRIRPVRGTTKAVEEIVTFLEEQLK